MKKSTRLPFVKKIVLVLIVVGALLCVSWLGYMKLDRDAMVRAKSTIIPDIVKKLDASVTLKDVKNLRVTSGIFEFDIVLDVNGKEQSFTSYMTKDGKVFFTGGIKVADLAKKEETGGAEQKKLTCQDLNAADAPGIVAYVVADCPFGIQMQRVMKKAIEEEGKLANFLGVRYIGSIENGKITSMHGDKEAQENVRQICIREEQKALYWPYVSCYMKEGKSDACISEAKVDSGKLSSCTTDASRGLSYAQKDFESAQKHQVTGSPTLVLNDAQIISEFDFGGRTPNTLKDIICCSAKTKPDFCTKTLSTSEVATSYSVSDESAGSTSASCATN